VAPDSVWEIVFLMVILKIPIVYLSMVIYYAVKAEPKPEEGASVSVGLGDDSGPGGRRRRPRPRRLGPHGRPTRSIPRTARAAATAARSDRR
jgi:hypothetical protein